MGQIARRQERPRRRAGAARAGDGRLMAPSAHAKAHTRRRHRRRRTRRGAQSRRRGDVAHLRRRHARRGRRYHGARALRPARRGRTGRRGVDADARRVRRGDPHGSRQGCRDPAARPLTPRAGDRDHPIRRRHRSALTTTRAPTLTERQLHRIRRSPTDRTRDPRLAREADGHPCDLAINRANERPRGDRLRQRHPPAGTRVPDRLRRLRDASPRRSNHLHHARPRPPARVDPARPPTSEYAPQDPGWRPAPSRNARAPRRNAPDRRAPPPTTVHRRDRRRR